MSRAGRRHYAELAKARARRYIRATWGERSAELADAPTFVGRRARTPHPCSCPMCCGNPRRLGEPTRRERMMDDPLA